MLKWKTEILLGIIPVLLLFVAFMGVDYLPIVMIGVLLIVAWFVVRMQRSGGAIGATGGSSSRKGTNPKPSFLDFNQIGGQDQAKAELMEALDFLIKKEQIAKLGIRPIKGILLTGPPGTGKTLLAKASAHYTNAVFSSASGSEFVEMYVGVGASRIRDLFKEARMKAQKENKQNAIIFIDEIDVIGGKREGGQQREYDQTLNQLLTEMDGIHTTEEPRILIVAATNRKEMLDSALLRPGRFDRHIEVDLPDKKGRMSILDIHARNKPLRGDVNMEIIAEQTFGFSGAQLESVLNEAAIYAMRTNEDRLTQKHLALAIDKVMMGEKTDRETNQEEKVRVAYHELGHAIVAEVVREGSVSQVSLCPRGKALGYVRHNPPADHYLYTKSYIEDQIMIALGGAAAEEIFYGARSTGSRNDFEKAMELVRMLVGSGLTNLGIVDIEMVPKKELMNENNAILNALMQRTKQLLDNYKPVFEQSLDVLMTEETLSGEQFRIMLKQIAS
ncbi:AAA family ATPase [Paenibacillus sp. KN14-4R]|uniref:AAA family ATPase n=1 Tax=Paenibacillus sp. KN14-4R TaxID=3445773 RepID=UPI003FA0CF34